MLPVIVGMTGACHHAQLFSIEMRSYELFLRGWLRTLILPVLASHVARMTGMYHCVQLLVEMGVS
jgi:hypothetical protein